MQQMAEQQERNLKDLESNKIQKAPTETIILKVLFWYSSVDRVYHQQSIQEKSYPIAA